MNAPTQWQRIGAAIVGVLLALLAAFSAGRFSAPLKVETRNVEHVVYQDRVVEKIVTVEAAAKTETKIVYRDRVITKDGTITEHEVEKTATAENSEKTTNAEKTEVKSGTDDKQSITKTTLQSTWRVALLAGGAFHGAPLVPIAGPLVLGLEVDMRIAGGVSAGVWANTHGAAGLSVSMEF